MEVENLLEMPAVLGDWMALLQPQLCTAHLQQEHHGPHQEDHMLLGLLEPAFLVVLDG